MKQTALAVCLLLAACGGGQGELTLPTAQEVPERVAVKTAEPQAIPASMRMVIRTATVSLVVENATEYLERVVAIVEAQGGYIAETRQWQDAGQVRATATLRIPAERLDPALQEIRKDAIRVASETVTGQDVSEEYADLGAQLTNLRATETELRQLLTTIRERTQQASEVLEVYRELSKVRGDSERLQGRLDFLKQMTAMSTINVELIPDVLSEPILEPGWKPMAIARTAARALILALAGLGEIVIWLVVFALPLGLAVAALAVLGRMIWKPIRRRIVRHQPQVPSPPA